jgi:hypothetical protein
VPADFRKHVEGLLSEDRRSEVVEYFFTQVVGVPAEFMGPMQADPSWQTMCRYAHTLPYDAQIAAGTQDGKPLPTDRWSISRPAEVVVGENSPAFFHEGAQALVDLLPTATLRVLPGQDHGAFWAAPDVLADMVVDAVTVPAVDATAERRLQMLTVPPGRLVQHLQTSEPALSWRSLLGWTWPAVIDVREDGDPARRWTTPPNDSTSRSRCAPADPDR